MNIWINLLINIGTTLLFVGVAWGVLKSKVTTLERDVQKKVDLAVFELHLKNEDGRFDRIEQQYRDISNKLDSLISSITTKGRNV